MSIYQKDITESRANCSPVVPPNPFARSDLGYLAWFDGQRWFRVPAMDGYAPNAEILKSHQQEIAPSALAQDFEQFLLRTLGCKPYPGRRTTLRTTYNNMAVYYLSEVSSLGYSPFIFGFLHHSDGSRDTARGFAALGLLQQQKNTTQSTATAIDTDQEPVHADEIPALQPRSLRSHIISAWRGAASWVEALS